MYYCKQTQDAEIYLCLLFQFFLFSISHSDVMNMQIFVKDFSGTTWPRILKFVKLYYVLKIQPHIAYLSLSFSISLSF